MSRVRHSNQWGRITILVTVLLIASSAALALSGSGTEADPWLIQSLADFDEFASDANYWDDYTRLETDVNLAGRVYDRAVIAWDEDDDRIGFQGTYFTGVFDGHDHKVMNLTVDGYSCLGLLGITWRRGQQPRP